MSFGGRLAIIGNTEHALSADGRLMTHAALAAQMDCWARQFDEVVFAGLMRSGPPPPSFAPYRQRNITLHPLRPAGGDGPLAKAHLASVTPGWSRDIAHVAGSADFVHLRSPCNVTLVAIPAVRALRMPRHAAYTGTWGPFPGESISSRIQRWMLRDYFGGLVHAYMPGPRRSNLIPSFSPSYSKDEVRREEQTVRDRVAAVHRSGGLGRPLRVVSAASFALHKRHDLVLDCASLLSADGVAIEFRLAGEGPTLERVRTSAAQLGLDRSVSFLGRLSMEDLRAEYRVADITLLASNSEGYGKSLLEGMAHGAIPVCADYPMAGEILGADRRGLRFRSGDSGSLARVLAQLSEEPASSVSKRILASYEYASARTVDDYSDLVVDTIETCLAQR